MSTSLEPNPITAKNFKTRLNGRLARHGISTVAQAEAEIFEVLSFERPTEIIALGYDSIKYLTPVNIGDKIQFTYDLISADYKDALRGTIVKWKVTTKNLSIGKNAVTAIRTILYSDAQVSEFGLRWKRMEVYGESILLTVGALVTLSPVIMMTSNLIANILVLPEPFPMSALTIEGMGAAM